MTIATAGGGSDVAYEQSVNESYLHTLDRRLRGPAAVGASRNDVWLRGYPRAAKGLGYLHPLIARVGLTQADDVLPASFYIGPTHHRWDGHECFSWAAPVAEAFFEPDRRNGAVDTEEVVVRRSFDHHVDTIVRLHDEWARSDYPSPFVDAELAVPAAPGGAARRRIRTPGPETGGGARAEPMAEGDAGPPAPATEAPRSERAKEPDGLLEGMRAPDAVIQRLRSPRSEKLSSVLGTLQPDQHALASAPSQVPLLIQGHPGTGKTIIAAYRAAHLTDPERAGGSVGSLLLVGPTREYVAHVLGLIAPLADPSKVRVVAMEDILTMSAKVKGFAGGALDGVADDVDAAARGLADQAANRLRASGALKSGTGARNANLAAVYEALRSNGAPGAPLSKRGEQVDWMSRLPSYERAVRLRRYLPLLAQCGLSIQQPPHAETYDHVIVDEAQDVTPIEWNVLDQYNRRGHWTLVGDMNQRRLDATYSSWHEIAEHLTLGDDVGEVEPTVIRRGYRSTQAILTFADKLLSRKRRGAQSLQVDGVAPTVTRVASADPRLLASASVEAAENLVSRHPLGTVAVITMDPAPVFQAMFARGWRRVPNSEHGWRHDGGHPARHLQIHVPESARGLEFDAVLVVEPAAFPLNMGRAGQLYTSLTRANRELCLVHHAPLPDALRKAGHR